MNNLKDYFKTGFFTLTHPVAGYNDFIEKKAFSKKFSIILVFVFYVAQCFHSLATGFSFTKISKDNFDFGLTFLVVIGILVLWSFSNWAISTLFDGEANLNQIWFVTAVATIPYSFSLIITTLLSNLLVADENIFIVLITTVGIAWSVMLLVVGLMLVQDYSLLGVILSGICSIVAMAILVVLGFLFFNLFKQLFSFFSDIVKELSYRLV